MSDIRILFTLIKDSGLDFSRTDSYEFYIYGSSPLKLVYSCVELSQAIVFVQGWIIHKKYADFCKLEFCDSCYTKFKEIVSNIAEECKKHA